MGFKERKEPIHEPFFVMLSENKLKPEYKIRYTLISCRSELVYTTIVIKDCIYVSVDSTKSTHCLVRLMGCLYHYLFHYLFHYILKQLAIEKSPLLERHSWIYQSSFKP